jgi:polyisoprenoid-binding protein YceI
MKNIAQIIAGLVVAAVIVVAGYLGYIWFSGGSGEPSTDISEAAQTIEAAGEGTRFAITTEGTEARFELDEDLRGIRTTAIGTSNQVAGEIAINFDNPQASQMGTIRVNARTLETDQAFRNRALRADILKSSQDEFEFIDFEPTALNGLPESIEMGATYHFEIVGNLRIVGQTHEATFAATITLDSESQISGTATTTVLRSDYGIAIPSVPSVANVEDEVELNLRFVAGAVQEE